MVIDISAPTAPRVAAVVGTPAGNEDELVIMNKMVYVGKAAVDVSAPEYPILRYASDIPGRMWRVSSTGKLFTISDEGGSGRYNYQVPQLNYVDPTRCTP